VEADEGDVPSNREHGGQHSARDLARALAQSDIKAATHFHYAVASEISERDAGGASNLFEIIGVMAAAQTKAH